MEHLKIKYEVFPEYPVQLLSVGERGWAKSASPENKGVSLFQGGASCIKAGSILWKDTVAIMHFIEDHYTTIISRMEARCPFHRYHVLRRGIGYTEEVKGCRRMILENPEARGNRSLHLVGVMRQCPHNMYHWVHSSRLGDHAKRCINRPGGLPLEATSHC
jgi:hypothetical protein